MPDPNLVVLYVQEAPASAKFYTDLLGRGPVEASPNFAMFALGSGLMLGLWSRSEVAPGATAAAGGSELVISVDSRAALQVLLEDWRRRKIRIAQEPTQMDFGLTFVALDPDGHRLRVMAAK